MLYKNRIKPTLDALLSALLLLLFIIPMLIIAALVKLTSPGPVLFSQVRYGLGMKPFRVYKFRTMINGAPEKSNQEFGEIGGYLTSIGGMLRATSLDELPQLFNIIRGEMSFVGPRPLANSDFSVVQTRHETGADNVRPGITGWAQVNGRNLISDQRKAELDLVYSKNISFELDLHILVLTIFHVLRHTGINHGKK